MENLIRWLMLVDQVSREDAIKSIPSFAEDEVLSRKCSMGHMIWKNSKGRSFSIPLHRIFREVSVSISTAMLPEGQAEERANQFVEHLGLPAGYHLKFRTQQGYKSFSIKEKVKYENCNMEL